MGLQWVYSGSTVGLQWLYSGSTVALQWLYSGSTMNKRRRMNEGITNLSRRKVEAKADIKRRLLVDFNFAKGASRTGGWCEPHRQMVRATRTGRKISKLANLGISK